MTRTRPNFAPTALAIAISFSVNKSVFWAIIHGLFSWLYVIYYILLY